MTNNQAEAEAFDNQIVERINNGHVPDLRYTTKCDYFYNNSWRHPEYVKLDFGDQFNLIMDSINSSFPNKPNKEIRVLEIGCGPGYISLELARFDYDVVGIDLSAHCIKIAQDFADLDPYIGERGSLEYKICNLFEFNPKNKFDAVLFLGALHHFSNQQSVMDSVKRLLKNEGVIAHEPTRDRVTKGNAVFHDLLLSLLSINDRFFNKKEIPENEYELNKSIDLNYSKLKYETEDGTKLQSVNDNEAGYKEMHFALTNNFNQIKLEDRYAFFHEVIGGLRFEEQINLKLARYLRDIDALLCQNGVLQATEFFFVGRKVST